MFCICTFSIFDFFSFGTLWTLLKVTLLDRPTNTQTTRLLALFRTSKNLLWFPYLKSGTILYLHCLFIGLIDPKWEISPPNTYLLVLFIYVCLWTLKGTAHYASLLLGFGLKPRFVEAELSLSIYLYLVSIVSYKDKGHISL